jgi:hypothetical protein
VMQTGKAALWELLCGSALWGLDMWKQRDLGRRLLDHSGGSKWFGPERPGQH